MLIMATCTGGGLFPWQTGTDTLLAEVVVAICIYISVTVNSWHLCNGRVCTLQHLCNTLLSLDLYLRRTCTRLAKSRGQNVSLGTSLHTCFFEQWTMANTRTPGRTTPHSQWTGLTVHAASTCAGRTSQFWPYLHRWTSEAVIPNANICRGWPLWKSGMFLPRHMPLQLTWASRYASFLHRIAKQLERTWRH